MPTELLADKYRLTSLLGQGAMGMVYRAHHLGIDGHHVRDVAIKMIRPDLPAAESETAARLFVREMKAAAQLKSPHVVTVYDWGRTEAGLLYYVMELVEAPTLCDEVLKCGQTTVPQAVEIATQVATVLVEAHNLRHPIVHRDLKPPNIFVAGLPDNAHVKVGDFGIAKILDNNPSAAARTATVVGTPLYMAPEQWTGSDIDTRVDLYALGVILYEMLAGRPPFSGPSAALMHQHLYTRAVPLPDHAPRALRDLVESLLAKSRDDRPPHAQAVADALLAQSGRLALIGAPARFVLGASGTSYVVFGGAGVRSGGNLNLSSLNGTNGFRLSGVAALVSDQSGDAVSAAGDVNGDGVDDVLIGASGAGRRSVSAPAPPMWSSAGRRHLRPTPAPITRRQTHRQESATPLHGRARMPHQVHLRCGAGLGEVVRHCGQHLRSRECLAARR